MMKDADGIISLFYSQSTVCRVNPELRENGWNPGGDILMTQSEDGEDWSYPVVLSSQGKGWPLVTANPPVVMRSGSGGTNWAIPVWRESPRKSTCDPQEQMQAMKELNPIVNDALSAGVLRGDVSCTENRIKGGYAERANKCRSMDSMRVYLKMSFGGETKPRVKTARGRNS